MLGLAKLGQWLGGIALAAAVTLVVLPVQAQEKISDKDRAAAQRLAAAVRIKTVTTEEKGPAGPEVWAEFHRFLKDTYPTAHRELERETVLEHSLLYTWKGRDRTAKPILLMAHMDVVPVADGLIWREKPFAGVIKDDVIWGRGSLDDKLSVLGLFESVEELIAEGFAPGRDIYLAFGHDEERDGFGAKAIARLLKQRGVRLDYVLDEGSVIGLGMIGGIDKPVAMVGLSEKGYLTVTLTAMAKKGSPAHSALPPEDTPIELLVRALAHLDENPFKTEIRPPVSEMLDTLAPEMPFWQRLAMGNRWLFDGIVRSQLAGDPTSNAMIRTTAVATIIKAGLKENVIPRTAKATVNYRILPGDTTASVLAHVEKVISEVDAGDMEIVIGHGTEYQPGLVSDPGSASYAALAGTINKIFPEAVVTPALVVAATDSRVYSEPDTQIADNIYRFLPVVLDSTRLASIHGINEHLPIADYAKVIDFYVELLRRTAGGEALVSEAGTIPSARGTEIADRPAMPNKLPAR